METHKGTDVPLCPRRSVAEVLAKLGRIEFKYRPWGVHLSGKAARAGCVCVCGGGVRDRVGALLPPLVDPGTDCRSLGVEAQLLRDGMACLPACHQPTSPPARSLLDLAALPTTWKVFLFFLDSRGETRGPAQRGTTLLRPSRAAPPPAAARSTGRRRRSHLPLPPRGQQQQQQERCPRVRGGAAAAGVFVAPAAPSAAAALSW